MGPLTYQLELPPRWTVHNVFNAVVLYPYRETEAHGPSFTAPPPEIIEGEEEYEVEGIISHRKRGKGYQYLIKWKDHPSTKNTWEPESMLTNAQEELEDYKKLK